MSNATLIDPKKPLVVVNKDDRDNYRVTVYGAVANWPKCNEPEPKMSEDKSAQLVKIDKQTKRPILKNGKEQPLWSWGVQLTVPKDTPGIKDLQEACANVRKASLQGVGKFFALKDGDKEADSKVADGKKPEYQEWMRGQWLISANSVGTIDRPPLVRNEVYGGAIVAAVLQLGTFDVGTNKGVKAFLQEIGRVAAGTRHAGGGYSSRMDEGVFEDDSPKNDGIYESDATTTSDAPATATKDDANPWE